MEKTKPSQSKIRQVPFIIGIAILFTLLVFFSIDALYEKPQWDKYCESSKYDYPTKPMPDNYTYNISLQRECSISGGYVSLVTELNGSFTEKCEMCQKYYDEANENYNHIAFFISAIIGAIAILLGLYLSADFEVILAGFMYGGILTIVIGNMMYITSLSKWAKVIVIGVELVLLILIGLKKFKIK